MKHNFSAGPSILPQPVFREAAQGVLDYQGIGLSILELSHRGQEFTLVMDEAVALVHELLDLDESYKVLFLSGGASSQFFMLAMNLLGPDDTGYYVDTGSWSKKAIAEARRIGKVEVIASSQEEGYKLIPKGFEVPSSARYLHVTSNNTIFGTQYHTWPDTEVPLISDMSSDIFSRQFDASKFGLIYAGAQKNMGPAGTTLVIIREDMLREIPDNVPTMLRYQTHIAKNSMFNTPPVFPIYVSLLNMRWLKEQGGVAAMEERNNAKAAAFYEAVDNNPCFTGVVEKEDRSHMNATFILTQPEHEATFLSMCKEAGIVGIKGHRSVGGFRASMYNAMTIDSVHALTEVMDAFAGKYA
jgi:phosphoserine aminotransferase